MASVYIVEDECDLEEGTQEGKVVLETDASDPSEAIEILKSNDVKTKAVRFAESKGMRDARHNGRAPHPYAVNADTGKLVYEEMIEQQAKRPDVKPAEPKNIRWRIDLPILCPPGL